MIRFIVNSMLLLVVVSCNAQFSNLRNYTLDLQDLIDSLGVDATHLNLLIDKSDYILSIRVDSMVIKQYPVVFGGNPVDDKLRQGDQCTPEGTFGMVSKYPHRYWSKFIWINYPTSDSWRKHNRAERDGVISEDAAIGGEIGIHGVPEGMDHLVETRVNWTLGCISLKNDDVNEIYPYIADETVILIRK